MGALKIGVTGSNGFIGHLILKRLKDQGHDVDGFDKPDKDILSDDDLSRFVKDKDIIVHFAALNRAEDDALLEVNTRGTLHLLQAMKKHGKPSCKLVFASSFLVYALSIANGSIAEDHELAPSSTYGLSKKFAEELIRHYQDNAVILRISNVYGPGGTPFYNSVIATFMQLAKDGKILTINGDGEQCRDYIFVDDVVDAIEASLQNGVKGTFNISSGELHSLNDIVKELNASLGTEVRIEYLPTDEPKSILKIDSSRFRKTTGWQPKHQFTEGMRKTVEGSE